MNRTWLRNGATQALRFLAVGVFLTVVGGCEGQIISPPGPPPPAPPIRASWLSYKYPANCVNCPDLTDQVEEQAYYCSIAVTGGSAATGIDPVNCPANQRPTLTFDAWKLANGFPAGATPGAHAIYGNLGDLRIGRDMNCVTSANGNIACYVTNYGPPPFKDGAVNPDWLGAKNDFPGLPQAIEDAIDKRGAFATVAMVYNVTAASTQSDNAVTFYVFDGHGNLFFSPALDGEGPKTNPRMCMACHGGKYDPVTHSVREAQFLPFDMFYFEHSAREGFGRDDDAQQEGYRQLNKLVKDTNPAPAIADFIDKMYKGAVETPSTKVIDDSYVPDGWSTDEAKKLYASVYRPYCRMCHMASTDKPFLTFKDFEDAAGLIEEKVCHSTDMPNAQVPSVGLGQNQLAVGDLRDFLRARRVTNLHGCN